MFHCPLSSEDTNKEFTSVLGCRSKGPGDWASKFRLPGFSCPLGCPLLGCCSGRGCFPRSGPLDPFLFGFLLLRHFLSPWFGKILVHFEGAGSASTFDLDQIFFGHQSLEGSDDSGSIRVHVVSSGFQSLFQDWQ